MGWMMPFGGGWMVIVWVAIIGSVVWGVVALTRRRDTGRRINEHNPMDVARGRYARGEISREEFEQIRRDLS